MKQHDLVIIGGGPAGLAAAIEAVKWGVDVVLFDENGRPGGQLFKQIHKFFGSSQHYAGVRGFEIGTSLMKEAEAAGVDVSLNTKVWGIFPDKTIAAVQEGRPFVIRGKNVLIATGASENAIAFPGCTLPGVMTAGAAQTMVNIHRVLPGKRILMIGSGNVGLIVSYQMMQAGAEVAAVVEASPGIGGYEVHAAKLRRAGVPIYCSHTISEAIGTNYVEGAVICQVDPENFRKIPNTEKRLEVDVICLAVGLTPRIELADLTRCKHLYVPALGGVVPVHDRNMSTTLPWLYVAGDVAGIEEASVALDEGRLAGITVAESLGNVNTDTVIKLKEKLWANLSALRGGPGGSKRLQAKQYIEMQFR